MHTCICMYLLRAQACTQHTGYIQSICSVHIWSAYIIHTVYTIYMHRECAVCTWSIYNVYTDYKQHTQSIHSVHTQSMHSAHTEYAQCTHTEHIHNAHTEYTQCTRRAHRYNTHAHSVCTACPVFLCLGRQRPFSTANYQLDFCFLKPSLLSIQAGSQ